MSLNQGSLGMENSPEASGAPFSSTSAHNGVSIDGDGKVVLGDDDGTVTPLANLINNRQINIGAFLLHLFSLGVFDMYINGDPAAALDGVIRIFGDFINAGFDGKIFMSDQSSNEAGQIYLHQQNGVFIVCQRNSIDGGLTGVAMRRANVCITDQPETPPARVAGAILQADGAIATEDPGNGQGVWKLGKKQAAAVVLDNANYVEVNIDGAIVKLAIVN